MGVGEIVGAAIQTVRLWRDRRRDKRERADREEQGRVRLRDQARRDLPALWNLQNALPRLRDCSEAAAREASREARQERLRKCTDEIRSVAARTRFRDVRQAVELAADRCQAWVAVESEETVADYLRECDDAIRKAVALIRTRVQETHDVASGELD